MTMQSAGETPATKRRIVPRPVEAPSCAKKRGAVPDADKLFVFASRLDFEQWFWHVPLPGGDFDVFRKPPYAPVPYVSVRDSSLPRAGKGVFARVDFRAGDVVGLYNGRVLGWYGDVDESLFDRCDSLIRIAAFVDAHGGRWDVMVDGAEPPQDEAEQRRVLRMPYGHAVPARARDWPGMFAHVMNDAEGPERRPDLRNNCRADEDGLIVTLVDIPGTPAGAERMDPRSELLWSYGREYWASTPPPPLSKTTSTQ